MKRKITVRLSDGTDELIFSESSPLRLLEHGLEGVDSLPLDVELEEGFASRTASPRRQLLGARQVTLSFEITHYADLRATRDRLSRLMTLGRELELEVWYLGRRRTTTLLPCREAKYYSPDNSCAVCVTLGFVGARAYFTEGIRYKSAFPAARGMSCFPLTLMPHGVTLSLSGSRIAANIYNPGDTDCPIAFTLFADGDVSDPSVMLGDKKITLFCELSAGDRVRIVTGCGHSELSAVGASYTGYSRKSRFFALPPGTSSAVINAASGVSSLRAAYEFEPRYLGI